MHNQCHTTPLTPEQVAHRAYVKALADYRAAKAQEANQCSQASQQTQPGSSLYFHGVKVDYDQPRANLQAGQAQPEPIYSNAHGGFVESQTINGVPGVRHVETPWSAAEQASQTVNPVHDFDLDRDCGLQGDPADSFNQDYDNEPTLAGRTYVVPFEFADALHERNGGPGIDGDSLLFVADEEALLRITSAIPSNRWSFDNELIHASIPHIVLDPAAGVELTIEWEVE